MINKAILYILCCLTLLTAAISLAGCKDAASTESDISVKSPLAGIVGSWRADSENGVCFSTRSEARKEALLGQRRRTAISNPGSCSTTILPICGLNRIFSPTQQTNLMRLRSRATAKR